MVTPSHEKLPGPPSSIAITTLRGTRVLRLESRNLVDGMGGRIHAADIRRKRERLTVEIRPLHVLTCRPKIIPSYQNQAGSKARLLRRRMPQATRRQSKKCSNV